MRRAVFFIVGAICFLVLSDPALGVDRTYQDAEENWTYALDITSVLVSDATSGYFIVDIDETNYQEITDQDELWVFLNTDRNRSNYYFGADYALRVIGSTGGPVCGLYGHWNGVNFPLITTLPCTFYFGTTFTFSRADVGNPPDFEFWVQSFWTPPPGTEESDRAPDSGWWLFDPTPPETTITGGPSGSTTNRNASLTFTSNEGGSTFQCSLDGSAFSTCGSPASYQNLALGGHTFRVRARDPSGNFDLSPATRGWTVVDGTPPETTITGGPSGSTTDRNASLTFTSNEGGSTFQCSLDGSAFSSCGSPASYQNLAFGAHTFRVRARDPSGNFDLSPATRGWTVVDGTPPTATVESGKCCVGGQAEIRYTINDNTGSAAAEVSIYRAGSSGASKVCLYEIDRARPDTYVARCALPKSARGWLRYCVVGQDAAGLRSQPSCGRVTFARLNATAPYRYDRIGGGNVRLTRFRLIRAGGRALIRCRGCSGRRIGVGTTVSPGGRIEVRVVKPLIRGAYIRLTNPGGRGDLRQFKACLPPGSTGPVVPCSRKS